MKGTRGLACLVAVLGCVSVAAAQVVSVTPQTLSFTYQIGGPNPAPQSIVVFNDIPTQFSVTVSGAPWLSVTPTSGLTPNTLICVVTPPAGAAVGTLSGSVIIGPPASIDSVKVVVPVSLQILAAAPGNLVVAPTALTFDYQTGAPRSAPRAISVTTAGSSAAFTVSTSTTNGVAWLSVSPTSGVTPATLSAYATPPSTMGPGTYSGTITVIPSYAGAAPQKISVTLRISAGGTLTANPGFLSFNYQPGTQFPQPQTISIMNSVGTPTTVNVSASTSSGGTGWLVISPGIATTPFNVIVSVLPGSLGPGIYYGTVSIAPAVGGAATLVPVNLSVYSSSQLIVNPSNLTFDYQSGGASPAAQYISVTSTGAPTNFNATLSGPPWISLSTTHGTTPTGVGVAVNPPSTTAPGTYNATVTLTPVSGSPVVVAVSVRVAAANYLSVGRDSISFDYAPVDLLPAAVVVPVTSSGASIRFDAVGSTLGFSPWLVVNQTSPYTPGHINVSVAPQGLAAGVYSGTISVVSDSAVNSPQTINVTLNVSNQPSFSANPFGMEFSYQIGGPPAAMQMAVVSNQGSPMTFALSAETKSGGNWLLAAGGGTTPATIAAAIDPGTLGPGTYTGNLVVKPTSGTGNSLQLPVILNVSPGPVFRPSANQVSFQYERTGTAPPSQKVTIGTTSATSSATSVVFYTTAQTGDGGMWLKVSPDVATSPGDITVTVDPQGLTPGLYYGLVVLAAASGETPTSYLPVSLQVSDGQILTVPSQYLIFTAKVGSAPTAPQTITVKGTGGRASSFQVTTFGASWVQVNPTVGTTDASLNVVASPDVLPAGYYFGVVSIEIPGVAGSQQYVPVALVLSTP